MSSERRQRGATASVRTTPLMPSGACETSSTDGSRIDEKKLSRIASVSLSIAFAGTCAQVRKIIAAVFGANSSSIATRCRRRGSRSWRACLDVDDLRRAHGAFVTERRHGVDLILREDQPA